jgi:hypothetical protein
MMLALPWPVKILIDNVVGNNPLPRWTTHVLSLLGGEGKMVSPRSRTGAAFCG